MSNSNGGSNPLKIQIALQGGGAKMAGLVAAMAAVEEFERNGEIRVTRIAGTSAGAVVGTMYAAGVSMDKLRSALEKVDLSPLQGSVGRMKLLYRIWRGKAIWPEELLSAELENMLRELDIEQTRYSTLGALGEIQGKKVHLTATNISERVLEPSTDQSRTVSKVVDSCALPFVFRNFNTPHSTILDGGICENLPAELLYEYEEEDGPVVALSFETQKQVAPTSLRGYVWALIDTVINRSTDRTVNRIPGRIHSIRTEIGTLDFDKAFATDYRDGEHKQIKKRAKRFFKGLLASGLGDIDPGTTSGDPWQMSADFPRSSSSPDAIMMRRVGRVYDSLRRNSDIVFDEYTMTVIAHGLQPGDDDGPSAFDEVRSVMRMRSEARPVWGYGFYISNAGHETVLYRNHCDALDAEGNDVLAAAIPMFSPKGDDERRYVGFFFEKPLTEDNGPFEIYYVDTIDGFVTPLRETGKDVFWITVDESFVKLAKIILHVPSAFGPLSIRPSDRSHGQPESLTNADLRAHRDTCPAGYKTYGWRCEDLEPKSRFEISVERRGAN